MRKNKRFLFGIRHYRKFVFHIFFVLIAIFVVLILLFLFLFFLARFIGFSMMPKSIPILWIALLLIFSIIVTSLSVYPIVRSIFKPLRDMSAASNKIAKGDYQVQLEYNGVIQEFAETIDSFNYMAKKLGSVELIQNDFISNVSHEFKTPLSSISGYLTFLQDDSLSTEERRIYIEKAFFSIEKLNNLTDNILRISRIEHQPSLDPPVTYRLDEQLRQAIVLLEPKWSQKNIAFDLNLPKSTYTGQELLLFQVWLNLISNAIKFSPDGAAITIKLEETPHHDKVYICDEGIGMDTETVEHIFDKFYQADSSRQTQGNGLGLALCKKILDRCGGKIFVNSKLGEGSKFCVQLRRRNS